MLVCVHKRFPIPSVRVLYSPLRFTYGQQTSSSRERYSAGIASNTTSRAIDLSSGQGRSATKHGTLAPVAEKRHTRHGSSGIYSPFTAVALEDDEINDKMCDDQDRSKQEMSNAYARGFATEGGEARGVDADGFDGGDGEQGADRKAHEEWMRKAMECGIEFVESGDKYYEGFQRNELELDETELRMRGGVGYRPFVAPNPADSIDDASDVQVEGSLTQSGGGSSGGERNDNGDSIAGNTSAGAAADCESDGVGRSRDGNTEKKYIGTVKEDDNAWIRNSGGAGNVVLGREQAAEAARDVPERRNSEDISNGKSPPASANKANKAKADGESSSKHKPEHKHKQFDRTKRMTKNSPAFSAFQGPGFDDRRGQGAEGSPSEGSGWGRAPFAMLSGDEDSYVDSDEDQSQERSKDSSAELSGTGTGVEKDLGHGTTALSRPQVLVGRDSFGLHGVREVLDDDEEKNDEEPELKDVDGEGDNYRAGGFETDSCASSSLMSSGILFFFLGNHSAHRKYHGTLMAHQYAR